MSEKTSGAFGGVRKAWRDPKAKKGMLLVLGIALIVLTVSLVMMNGDRTKAPGPRPTARVVAPPTNPDDVTGSAPDSYRSLVRESDQDRSKDASGKPTAMVIPRVTGDADGDARRPTETEAEQRGRMRALAQADQAPAPMRTSAQAAGVDPSVGVRQSEQYRVALQLMQRVVTQTTAAQGNFAPTSSGQTSREPAATATQSAAPNTASSGGGASPVARGSAPVIPGGKPVIRAGEIAFANTDVALNSDFSGPVIVTIREGKFNGARLVGQKTLERDAIVIRFSTLSPADGSGTYPVQAYAVSLGDAKTFGVTGLTGETDYHAFERYILPGAAAFVQAFGLSATQKGQTTSVSDNGIGTSVPGLTNSDRYAVAIGSAMTPLLSDLRQRGQRPVTVSMPAGTEIGVMFGADVFNPATQRANANASAVDATTARPAAPEPTAAVALRELQQSAELASARAQEAAAAAALQQGRGYGATPYTSNAYGMSPSIGFGAGAGYQTPSYAGYR